MSSGLPVLGCNSSCQNYILSKQSALSRPSTEEKSSSKFQDAGKNNNLDQSYKWPGISRGDGSKLSKLSNLCSSSAVWKHTTKCMAAQNCVWKQAVFLSKKSLLTVLKGFSDLLYLKCVLLLKKNKKVFQIKPVLWEVLPLKVFSGLSALIVSKLTGQLSRLARGQGCGLQCPENKLLEIISAVHCLWET